MDNKKLKFLLVGCGRIAHRHAEHIMKYGELSAVCDINYEKALEFKNSFNTKAYQSLEKMLENEKTSDVVSICTPNGLHYEHTVQSLRKGFHVLVEKPMAISVLDCGEMIKEAEKHNRRLFVVKQNRFNPPIQAVKKLIEEKRLGKILSLQLNCFWNRRNDYYEKSDWKGKLELDGGTLFTQFSHFIDLIYWLLGDVREVKAYIKNSNHLGTIEFEDNGVVILQLYNGALGTIHFTINSFDKNMEGSITIFGEKGTVKVGGQYLNELEYQSISGYQITNLPQGNKANDYGNYQGSMSNHDKVYENVIEVLQNGGAISTNGFEGLKTVEIIQKIYDSINTSTSSR